MNAHATVTDHANSNRLYILAADIELTSPMKINDVRKGRFDPMTGKLTRNNFGKYGVECSLTRSEPIMSTVNGGQLLPVIPASTISGRLRRAAADLIVSALQKDGKQITPAAYNTLRSGSSSTHLATGSDSPALRLLTRNDPFFGLFGGTPLVMPASCVISTGWPLLKQTQPLLMTAAWSTLHDENDYKDLTDVMLIVRKDDVADASGAHFSGLNPVSLVEYFDNKRALKKDGEAKDERAKATKEAGEVVDANDISKKTELRALNGAEVVRTGVKFALRIAVNSGRPVHLGMMALALQQLMLDGQIGGGLSKGMGRFRVLASRLLEVDPQTRQQTELCELFLGERAFGMPFAKDPGLTDAIALANDYASKVSPALLGAFDRADVEVLQQLLSPKQVAKKAAKECA